MRVSSSAAVRSNAGYEALGRWRPRAPGRARSNGRARAAPGTRADLANAVTQGDHRVESLRAELVEVLRSSLADVEPVGPQDADGVGMERSSGCCRRLRRARHPQTSARPAPRRSATEHCCRCTGTTPAARRREPCARGLSGATTARCIAGCSAAPAPSSASRTGGQVDRVVAVATVRRAAPSAHQPTIAKQTKVIRDQALWLVDEHRQLPHGSITLHELSQQPPPHRVRRQPYEQRRVPGVRVAWASRSHDATVSASRN